MDAAANDALADEAADEAMRQWWSAVPRVAPTPSNYDTPLGTLQVVLERAAEGHKPYCQPNGRPFDSQKAQETLKFVATHFARMRDPHADMDPFKALQEATQGTRGLLQLKSSTSFTAVLVRPPELPMPVGWCTSSVENRGIDYRDYASTTTTTYTYVHPRGNGVGDLHESTVRVTTHSHSDRGGHGHTCLQFCLPSYGACGKLYWIWSAHPSHEDARSWFALEHFEIVQPGNSVLPGWPALRYPDAWLRSVAVAVTEPGAFELGIYYPVSKQRLLQRYNLASDTIDCYLEDCTNTPALTACYESGYFNVPIFEFMYPDPTVLFGFNQATERPPPHDTEWRAGVRKMFEALECLVGVHGATAVPSPSRATRALHRRLRRPLLWLAELAERRRATNPEHVALSVAADRRAYEADEAMASLGHGAEP